MNIKNISLLVRLDKPIGTLLLLWPTLGALIVAAHGIPPLYVIVVFSVGTFLTRSAGCAINDALDADFDRHVQRTQNRVIANGVITKNQAVFIGILLNLLAFIMAVICLKADAVWLSLPAVMMSITYPLMKRFCPLPQAYLGIAYSFGILMAFMEVAGALNYISGMLFVANLLWVVGYDTVYALVDKADDLKIGIKTAAITLGKRVNGFIIICYTGYFLLYVMVGIILALNIWYFLLLLFVLALLIYQIIVLLTGHVSQYFRLFLLNNWVGLIMFAGLFIGFR